MTPSMTLVIKLAALVVHYEEMVAETNPRAASVDAGTIESLRDDDEVRAFMDAPENAALLPLKRSKR